MDVSRILKMAEEFHEASRPEAQRRDLKTPQPAVLMVFSGPISVTVSLGEVVGRADPDRSPEDLPKPP